MLSHLFFGLIGAVTPSVPISPVIVTDTLQQVPSSLAEVAATWLLLSLVGWVIRKWTPEGFQGAYDDVLEPLALVGGIVWPIAHLPLIVTAVGIVTTIMYTNGPGVETIALLITGFMVCSALWALIRLSGITRILVLGGAEIWLEWQPLLHSLVTPYDQVMAAFAKFLINIWVFLIVLWTNILGHHLT